MPKKLSVLYSHKLLTQLFDIFTQIYLPYLWHYATLARASFSLILRNNFKAILIHHCSAELRWIVTIEDNDQLYQVNVHQCIKCSTLRIKIFQLMFIGCSTFRDQDFPMNVHQWRFFRYDSVDLGIGGDHFFSGKSPMWRKRIKSSVKNSLTGRKISQQTQIKSRGGNKMWKVKSFRKIYS